MASDIKLFNMDCMEALREMEDNQFDLAIVDPPYGIERFKKGGTGDGFKADDRFDKQGLKWDRKPNVEYFNELMRVSKNQIIWGANNFTLPPSEYFCIWNKEQTVDNFATAEYAWVSMGLRKPAKIFVFSIHKHNQANKIHPTQKPEALYKWLLNTYAKEGDKILDTHFGSLSIGVACWDLGFDLTAYELDEDYFKAGFQRLETHKEQGQFNFA